MNDEVRQLKKRIEVLQASKKTKEDLLESLEKDVFDIELEIAKLEDSLVDHIS